MKTNDYFLTFSKECPTVQDALIPAGYVLYHYKEVYIPARVGLYYRGSGTNPATMDVPIHYIANPPGLQRAITFLMKMSATENR